MREIDQDTIDAMFPDGYMIFYTCPDGQIRFNIYNPRGIPTLNKWASILMQNEGEGAPPAKWEDKDTGMSDLPPEWL